MRLSPNPCCPPSRHDKCPPCARASVDKFCEEWEKKFRQSAASPDEPTSSTAKRCKPS